MGFSIVTTIPDMCNVQCFCYKAGLKNFPNIQSEWWCEGLCCCFFSNCGLNELLECQICPLGPCKLTSPALNITTAIPACLQMNVLCYKWGIQMPPNFMKEDFIVNKCLCCHNECGLKDVLDVFQFFCLKCTTGIKVGV